MAKISQLPQADYAAIDGSERVPVVKGGSMWSATIAALLSPFTLLMRGESNARKQVIDYRVGLMRAGGTDLERALTADGRRYRRVDKNGNHELGLTYVRLANGGKAFEFPSRSASPIVAIDAAGRRLGPVGTSAADDITKAIGTRLTLTDYLGQTLDVNGLRKSAFQGRDRLRDTSRKIRLLKRGGATANGVLLSWAYVADSWGERSNPGLLENLASSLKAVLGDGGPGWASFGRSSVAAGGGVTVTVGAGWVRNSTFNGNGPDLGEITSSTVGDAITVTVTSTVVVNAVTQYLVQPGGGKFRWKVGAAGAWTTVDTAGPALSKGSLNLSTASGALPGGAFVLYIEVAPDSTGPVSLFGANLTGAKGFVLHRVCYSGSTTQHWASASAVSIACLNELDPDLTSWSFGTNDQASTTVPDGTAFEANIAALIANRRAGRAGADCLVCSIPENLGGRARSMAIYDLAALRAAAANDAGYVGHYKVWWNGAVARYNQTSPRVLFDGTVDLIHLRQPGYDMLEASLVDYILQGSST